MVERNRVDVTFYVIYRDKWLSLRESESLRVGEADQKRTDESRTGRCRYAIDFVKSHCRSCERLIHNWPDLQEMLS